MYRTVTRHMGEALEMDVFDDPRRVEHLIVVFADRYVDAHKTWRAGGPPTSSWRLAFEFSRRGRGSALQHLLLGMNAHINLDLGAATAAVSTADDLATLHGDFGRVNRVLFGLVDGIQAELGAATRWMAWLDRLGLGWDEAMMRTGIGAAREWAWDLAEHAVAADDAARVEILDHRDHETERLGQLISNKWSVFNIANRWAGRGDCRDLNALVDHLAAAQLDLHSLSWT